MGLSCKKDTTNIDQAVGKWTVSLYNDNGHKLGMYYIDITKNGNSLTGTITECFECYSNPYFINKINFSKDNITFSYQLVTGYVSVNATLQDDKTLEGTWNNSAGEVGDWLANK